MYVAPWLVLPLGSALRNSAELEYFAAVIRKVLYAGLDSEMLAMGMAQPLVELCWFILGTNTAEKQKYL